MPDHLLQVEDLSVRFGDGPLAVDHASFHVDQGESVALVGESGSGKSVTALSILQLLPYPLASHPSGRIRLEGTELLGAPENTLRKVRGDRIGMVFQEPMTSLNPLHTVEKQIRETLFVHKGMDTRAARRRTLELLELVGLPRAKDRLDAYPHQLSGGQRQRVMIAMALANDPDLLIADEPTTALDVTIQKQVLDLLQRLQRELGMALLLITHDLGIVQRISERVYVMNQGQMVETGPTAQVFTRPNHPYTRQLMAAEPTGSAPPARPDAPVVMRAEALRVWFPIGGGVLRGARDHVRAVDGVDITVRAGHSVGVVGESGSGKTTLGLALLRLVKSQGTIEFEGRNIQDWRTRQLRPLRQRMQVVFQDPFSSLSPRLSVGQIVGEGLQIHRIGRNEAERRDRIVRVLTEVGLDPETRHRYPHEFSGGQRQRIAIARAMVLEPRLVILDEPTSALDRSVQKQIVELLRDLQARHGLAYVFISHDLKVIRALCHHVMVMKDGQVVEQGPADALFEEPRATYTRSLLDAALYTDYAAAATAAG